MDSFNTDRLIGNTEFQLNIAFTVGINDCIANSRVDWTGRYLHDQLIRQALATILVIYHIISCGGFADPLMLISLVKQKSGHFLIGTPGFRS